MANKIYQVAPGAILSSRADGKNYREGAEIDLSHLSDVEIATLKQMGKIVEKTSPKAEVKDGKADVIKTDSGR